MELLDICDCVITLEEKVPARLSLIVENSEGAHTSTLRRESTGVLVEELGAERHNGSGNDDG